MRIDRQYMLAVLNALKSPSRTRAFNFDDGVFGSRFGLVDYENEGDWQAGYIAAGRAVVFGPRFKTEEAAAGFIARVMEVHWPRKHAGIDEKTGRQLPQEPAEPVCARALTPIDRSKHRTVDQLDEVALAEQWERDREADALDAAAAEAEEVTP